LVRFLLKTAVFGFGLKTVTALENRDFHGAWEQITYTIHAKKNTILQEYRKLQITAAFM